MIRRLLWSVSVVLVAAACGGGGTSSSAPASTPATAPPAASAPKPTAVALLEPADGAMSGHIDMFRWEKVDGADEYVIKIQASDGRVVWEAPLAVTETKLPATVALEPEVHTWSVTARKGGQPLASSAIQKFTITP